MHNFETMRIAFSFTPDDQERLYHIGEILLPQVDQLTEDFYIYLKGHPETAAYLQTEDAIRLRKETFKGWFRDLFTVTYDNRYIQQLSRIGKVHVEIGLRNYHVDAAVSFVRENCTRMMAASVRDCVAQEELLLTMNKALDINHSIMTSSFQEERLKKEFLSHRVESRLILWSERVLHGLNLILVFGLLCMAAGVVGLLCYDITYALTHDFEYGVIKALGSLLILWMMIELLHTEIEHLQGAPFKVRIFIELALAAFIRKLFVASFKYEEPTVFAMMITGLLVLGIVYFLVARVED